MRFKSNINNRPHTKGLRSKKDYVIHIDMNRNMVTGVRVINYTSERIKYEVITDTGLSIIGFIDKNTFGDSILHTKLYKSSWLEVRVTRESDNSLVEVKRVTLD
jgi:hypothetical protein